jgi:hypothetical protein
MAHRLTETLARALIPVNRPPPIEKAATRPRSYTRQKTARYHRFEGRVPSPHIYQRPAKRPEIGNWASPSRPAEIGHEKDDSDSPRPSTGYPVSSYRSFSGSLIFIAVRTKKDALDQLEENSRQSAIERLGAGLDRSYPTLMSARIIDTLETKSVHFHVCAALPARHRHTEVHLERRAEERHR